MTWFCQALGFKPTTEQEIEELLKRPSLTAEEFLRDLFPANILDELGENAEAQRNGNVSASV
jgi:hypothetical protein